MGSFLTKTFHNCDVGKKNKYAVEMIFKKLKILLKKKCDVEKIP